MQHRIWSDWTHCDWLHNRTNVKACRLRKESEQPWEQYTHSMQKQTMSFRIRSEHDGKLHVLLDSRVEAEWKHGQMNEELALNQVLRKFLVGIALENG